MSVNEPHSLTYDGRGLTIGKVQLPHSLIRSSALTRQFMPDDGWIDLVAIERRLKGDNVRLTVREAYAVAGFGSAEGYTHEHLAVVLGVHVRNIARWLGVVGIAKTRQAKTHQSGDDRVHTLPSWRRMTALAFDGWTTGQIAKSAGINLSMVRRVLSGRQSSLSRRDAEALAAAFDDMLALSINERPDPSKYGAAQATRTAIRHGWVSADVRQGTDWDSVEPGRLDQAYLNGLAEAERKGIR